MREPCVEVVVPGSTANLGPGFDSIGMALNLFTRVRVRRSDVTKVTLHGDNLAGLPENEDNLILQVMHACFEKQGKHLPPLQVDVWSEIPLTRGLGSSAAALAAGLVAANALLGNAYSEDDLLQLGTAWEGHPDNIGASLIGGVVIGSWDGKRASVIKVEPPPLSVVVAIPAYELPTEEARQALPASIPFRDAILSSSKANVLTAALIQRRWDLLETAMDDLFHQPYRTRFIPGMKDILMGARDHGALGVALSGAGPTLLAFSHSEDEQRVGRFFEDTFARLDRKVTVRYLKPWAEGATLQLTEDEQMCKVVGKTEGVSL